MSGRGFLFSTHFVILPIWYWKRFIKSSHVYISVKCGPQRERCIPRGAQTHIMTTVWRDSDPDSKYNFRIKAPGSAQLKFSLVKLWTLTKSWKHIFIDLFTRAVLEQRKKSVTCLKRYRKFVINCKTKLLKCYTWFNTSAAKTKSQFYIFNFSFHLCRSNKKPQPQHRTKFALSGKSARSQIRNVVHEIVIAWWWPTQTGHPSLCRKNKHLRNSQKLLNLLYE